MPIYAGQVHAHAPVVNSINGREKKCNLPIKNVKQLNSQLNIFKPKIGKTTEKL